MLRLLLLSLHTVVFAQRFLPGQHGEEAITNHLSVYVINDTRSTSNDSFRGFGPPGGGPSFFGGGPPFGGPGFDFGPGPGAGEFLPDFPAIGGPSIFTPPRGPPDFDRIRRENGGFPVWGGAGINREDGTRAFDGWDGDPARLGVGSFSSQVGPSHLLESQHGSSDDRDPTVVQTTRVVVRPSPFRIPRRPTPTRTNQRETREQYTRSIAQVRRNTLSTHTQNNNRIPQTQNVRTGNNGYTQNNNRLSQAQNIQNNENGNNNHRVPRTQRVSINSHTNSNSRQVHQSHRNDIPVVSQRHNIPPQGSLRDTGQQGILRHQGQRNQNVPPSTQTRTLQTSSAGQSTVVNRQARRPMPLVYSQRFISQHRGSNNHIINTNNGINAGNENDPNNLSPAINDAAWIPGPIPGLEMINNNRQNTGHPQSTANSRNTNLNSDFQNSPGIGVPRPTDNQNTRHQPLTGSIASRSPITNNQPLSGQNIDPGTPPNNQPPRGHQSFLLPSSNRHSNLVVQDKREPSPLSISIRSDAPNPPLPPHQPLPQQGTVGPPPNHQQRSLDHPHPPNQQQPLVPSHQEPPPNHASQGSNPDPLVPSGQHSTAEAGPGGIGGVFGGPTGGATTGGGGATGGGGRFADPTTGERIQVVSSDMANAVRQARVGGDPRAGTFGRGPSVGQGIPPQGRFVPDRSFVSGPGPVGVGPQGVGMGPQGFGSQGGGVGGVGPQGIGGPSMGPGGRFDGGPSMGPGGRFDGGSSMGPGGRFDGRPGFMGPGAGPRSGAGLLSGPGGAIRIRIPADGGRPIITRDGVSQPLPPGMSLTDLGISSPPPSRPIRGPGPGAINNNNINNGFIQNGGGGFSNGTLPRLLLVGDPGMSNNSRLSRFQSGYGMFGRGRVYENLLSTLGRNYVQVLLPGQRQVNNQVGNAVSPNENVLYISNRTGNIFHSHNINNNNNNNDNNNNNNNVPVNIQSHTTVHIPIETPPPTIKTTIPSTQAPVTSSQPPPTTTTTTDIPEEIEPTPSMYHGGHIDTAGTSYAGLSKFQRTVADMLGLSASHVLIRNLSMIENMAHMNGFEIELEREGAMAAMQGRNGNQLMPETTTVAITTPLTTASVIPLDTSPPVKITHHSPITNANKVNSIPGTNTNNNIENNLTQNGFLRTLNSLLASGKRQVNVNFDTNTGVYKLSTKPVLQAPAPEWQPAHAQRREHPSVAHTLTGFLPPQFDPGVMVQPTGGQTMVTGVSGLGPADMGHSHSSGGIGEVHNNNNMVANNNNNNLDVGVNNNGAPDLLVIQMADLRNRDNLPAIMNALENIANAQGGGGGAAAGVVGPVGIDNRNNAIGGGRI